MTRNLSGRITAGSIIVIIGIVLLLSTVGIIEMRSVWGWIPALFVLIGVWALFRSDFRNLVGPVMIIAIAGAFLLRNVGIISDGAIGTWWPLFIVLFGVLIMVNRSRRRQRTRLEGHSAGEITAIGIFGSDESRPVTDRFTGGELVAIFGDARLDLENASVQESPAMVETMAVFGDVEIRAPESWNVKLQTLNIFGDTTDRRRESDKRNETDSPDLVVTGFSLFGDIEVRN
ncbi:cell wall-active antibiotics response protein [Salinarchaeum sp. IM2453]|uniref:LiaF transmembrane domain-containing protein n=1 Tax=Salinarchaeum sp. IM2453 TaxID=2862870 RepID=UPI001C83E37E|nr:LiaF domain-containing protein [Salinarchaeum sp. IM2453]QZA88383.1 cell wall-active antibiotics response protein [Salinarchaeum sp. IM2453]